MPRSRFVQFVVYSVVLATAARVAADPPPRPNLVVILADDMGYGDASCYGNTAWRTPHIDRLAAEGMRLTDFHSSGPVCSPTRAGLLTGRYQQRAGIPGVINADPKVNRHHGLMPAEVTFAELLRQAGYCTGVFGKWHLGYRRRFNPIHHGFDRFRGYVSGNVDYISHVDRMGIADWWDGDRLAPEPGYSTHLITTHAVRFIEANRQRPFCLYIAHECPHSPYQAPGDKPVRQVGRPSIPGAARRDIATAYREMMIEMDSGVGQVISTLKRLKLAERTFVFFCSDNGANRRGSNGRLRGYKGSLWEGGHRVPAIGWWPGRIEAGSQSDQTAISLDVMPTLLDFAGVKPAADHPLDGISLAGMLTGKTAALPTRTLFWQYRKRAAVRQGPWKLVTTASRRGPSHLFKLDDDPGEQKDLADVAQPRFRKMMAALKSWQEETARGATRQSEP